jgi:hypothetical protein
MSKRIQVAEDTLPAWVEVSIISIQFFHSIAASLPTPMPTKDLQIVLIGILEYFYLVSLPQELQTRRSVHILKAVFRYKTWGFQGIQKVGLRARHIVDRFLEVPAPAPVAATVVAVQIRAL